MSTGTIESRSPQDQSDVVVSAPAADREVVAGAFKRAREAFPDWSRSALARADALAAAADGLAAAKDDVVDLMVREVGKPLTESVMEHGRAVRILRYQAQAAMDPDGDTYPTAPPADMRTLLMSRRRPRGVAGLITPWNFPFAIPLWKAAPALAYGNTVVLKPASDAIACALRLQEILGEHLPEGVFNVVTGPGAAGQALVEMADVVSFTGSTAVGLGVAAGATARGIPSQAEMGGLNASIVLPDADVESAAKVIAGAAMGYAGQKCTATGRVIVLGDPARVHRRAGRRGRRAAGRRPGGRQHGRRPGDQPAGARRARVGGAGARRATAGASSPAAARSTARACSSRRPSSTARSRRRGSRRRRSSGRSSPCCAPSSAEQAVEISNGVAFGLVTSVFTRDLDAALTVVDGLETGMIRINMPTSGVDFHAPFGGEKQSSFGPREQGKAARELYTTTHTITIGPAG